LGFSLVAGAFFLVMKSWKGEHAAKPLRQDLALVDVARTGFWWCDHCKRITEPLDAGEVYPQCTHCHARRMRWHAGQPPDGPISRPEALPQWREPNEGKPFQKRHRLPQEERNLRLLARTGYWFCFGCKEITKRTEQEECAWCGSSKVEWQAPVFQEAMA